MSWAVPRDTELAAAVATAHGLWSGLRWSRLSPLVSPYTARLFGACMPWGFLPPARASGPGMPSWGCIGLSDCAALTSLHVGCGAPAGCVCSSLYRWAVLLLVPAGRCLAGEVCELTVATDVGLASGLRLHFARGGPFSAWSGFSAVRQGRSGERCRQERFCRNASPRVCGCTLPGTGGCGLRECRAEAGGFTDDER